MKITLKSKSQIKSYYGVLAAAFIVLGVAVYRSVIYDPAASSFLALKTIEELPAYISLWINVMVAHVLFACIAVAAGACNFSYGVFKGMRRYHKPIGYIYVIAILIVDLTSGFMAITTTGGKVTGVAFNLLNIYWPIATFLAIRYAKKGMLIKHKSWMVRSYLFCFLNMFIHSITTVLQLLAPIDFRQSYSIAVLSSILICIVFAEIIVRQWIIPRK